MLAAITVKSKDSGRKLSGPLTSGEKMIAPKAAGAIRCGRYPRSSARWVFFMLAVALQYARSRSFVERLCLPVYARTWMHGLFPKAQTRYSLIAGVTTKGRRRIALTGEVEAATNAQGQTVYVLTEERRRNGLVRLVWDQGLFNDRRLDELLGHWIRHDQTVWDYIERPVCAAPGAFGRCSSRCRRTGRGGWCENTDSGCAGRNW